MPVSPVPSPRKDNPAGIDRQLAGNVVGPAFQQHRPASAVRPQRHRLDLIDGGLDPGSVVACAIVGNRYHGGHGGNGGLALFITHDGKIRDAVALLIGSIDHPARIAWIRPNAFHGPGCACQEAYLPQSGAPNPEMPSISCGKSNHYKNDNTWQLIRVSVNE